MKKFIFPVFVIGLIAVMSGCATGPQAVGVTNQNQPGPVVGRALGTGAGVVVGNVAGGAAGFGEGVAGGVHSSFDNTQRVVRYWREEKTPDGRVILVPEEFLVDANGRVMGRMR